jgi:hypothetical protein
MKKSTRRPLDGRDSTKPVDLELPEHGRSPQGAHQGGAPRGSSRLDPSHQHEMIKKDRPRKPGGKR